MKKIILVCLLIGLTSCTDSTIASLKSYGDSHIIEMYSGGNLIRRWVSTGKVTNAQNSDGYQFMDKETSKLVRVSGDVVITIGDK